MIKQTKALLVTLIAIAVLSGGFLAYNKLIVSQKSLVPEKPETTEEPTVPAPKLTISAPSEIEVTAYKAYSFNFSIKNEEKCQEAKDVNVTLRGIIGEISPSNITIPPGKLIEFKVKLDGLKPGNYTLYLETSGKPDVSIAKTISVKSQIVVGLDGYHFIFFGIRNKDAWKAEKYYDEAKFVKYLNKNGIKTKTIESPFSPQVLKNINLLIIEDPLQPFLLNEKQELKNFLNDGNSLLIIGPSMLTTYHDDFTFLNDLLQSFHVRVKFSRSNQYIKKGWTNEIAEHPATLGVEKIWCDGGYALEIKEPVVPLVKREGGTIYAVQYYAKGKIGIIGSGFYGLSISSELGRLNLNLIKWLVTPEVYKEMG